MRALAVLAAVATLAAGATTGSATRSERPTLRVTPARVFTVIGTHFVAGEHVTVVVRANGRFARTVTASSTGRFAAAFRRVHIVSCSSFRVSASGDEGSRAWLRFQPECPQPLQP